MFNINNDIKYYFKSFAVVIFAFSMLYFTTLGWFNYEVPIVIKYVSILVSIFIIERRLVVGKYI